MPRGTADAASPPRGLPPPLSPKHTAARRDPEETKLLADEIRSSGADLSEQCELSALIEALQLSRPEGQ